MDAPLVHHSKCSPTSPFLRGWRSLPAELRLNILEHVLILSPRKGCRITVHDYPLTRNPHKHCFSSPKGRFAKVLLPLLACVEVDDAFNLPQVALELWYGRNAFFLGGPYISDRGGTSGYYRYLLPHRSAFAHLQRVHVHTRGDYAGWTDLASYCEATQTMPKLKAFDLQFASQPKPCFGSTSLQDAFNDVGRLTVSTQKLVVDYFGKHGVLGPLRSPAEKDRVDYPEAGVLFRKLGIERTGEVGPKESFRRYWDDLERVAEAGELWILPPASMYPW
jgi:hypothetical protein